MTGTALENRVDEMLALIGILQPDVAAEAAKKRFMSTAPQFRALVAPVYYRRKREDVLSELPELIETQEWLTPAGPEIAAYEQAVLLRNFQAMRRVSWSAEDPKDSCKAQRMLELCEEAASEDRKILVFSFFLDTLRKVKELLGDRCYGPINGSVPIARRQEIIDAFQEAPLGSVLAAQVQTGGTGLNIQSASVVILCEPQLKPSTEMQAISRAYRMGQARNVLVYRLLCENSVDTHIMEILERKQDIFNAFADESAAAETDALREMEIDEKTIGQIVELEYERVTAGGKRRLSHGGKNDIRISENDPPQLALPGSTAALPQVDCKENNI